VPIEDNDRDTVEDQSPADLPRGPSREARRFLRYMKHTLGDIEMFLPVVLRATPTGTSRRLTDETQVVIEGFPRSGNTFASRAMEHAADGPIVISSHVHVPAGVMRAVHLHYPTLVLIRRPVDSICSEKIAAPHASLPSVVRDWTSYYRKVWPYRDDFVVATFDQVTTDFGAVTARLNERFGTSFAHFEHSDENNELVFDAIDRKHLAVHGNTEHFVPRPSPARHAAKDQLLERLQSPELQGPLEEAAEVYRDFAKLAGAPED